MPKQTAGNRAAIYARVSTEEQGDNNSIPDQLFVCRQYAESHDLGIVGEYIDMESGLKGSRTNIDMLIADAKRGLFDMVIVKKIDRLGRGPRAFYRIMDQLDNCVAVKFAAEDYPEEVIPFLVAFGGLEVKMIKERTSAGRRTKARSGRISRPPRTLYGYAYDPETEAFVINEAETRWVRQIFAWHVEGIGVPKITHMLNQEGVPSRLECELTERLTNLADEHWCRLHGIRDVEAERNKVRARLAKHNGWYTQIVAKLLKNASYCGEGFVNKHTVEGTKRVLRPREEWIAFSYPPIIDRTTFDAAQAVTDRLKRYRTLQRSDREYMLRGILYCAECQKGFVITYAPWHRVAKDGTKTTYERGTRGYRCRGMRYYPHLYQCRRPANVVAHRVEQAVWEKIYTGLQNPELLGVALECEGRMAQEAESHLLEAIGRIERRLADLDIQSQRILRLFVTGKWAEADLDMQRTVIMEEREALEAELAERYEQRNRQIDHRELLRRVSTIAEVAAQLPVSVRVMTPDEYRQAMDLVRLILQRVTLDRHGKLTIDMTIGEVQPRSDAESLPISSDGIAEPSQGGRQSS